MATPSNDSLPLAGIRVLELAGLAPGPFAGQLLADYGASVLRIDRPTTSQPFVGADNLTRRKASIKIDLRDPKSCGVLTALLPMIDVLIDPFRPGVLERLGLSAVFLQSHNPRLIVARLTGFRRDGKYKDMAGHDINYIAVSGALSMLGRATEPPYPPANLLGDFAGGGMVCFVGIMLALAARNRNGHGQVVEANMADGSAYMTASSRLARRTAPWNYPRGQNLLDGGCPWYNVYETKDKGKYFAVGALEPAFYGALIKGLGWKLEEMPDRDDRRNWPLVHDMFRARFSEKTRAEWEAIFDGTDACATPVVEQDELENTGHQQRPIVHLTETPGLPIPPDDGGWTIDGLVPGTYGEDLLKVWTNWQRGEKYDIGKDGVIVTLVDTAKSKL